MAPGRSATWRLPACPGGFETAGLALSYQSGERPSISDLWKRVSWVVLAELGHVAMLCGGMHRLRVYAIVHPRTYLGTRRLLFVPRVRSIGKPFLQGFHPRPHFIAHRVFPDARQHTSEFQIELRTVF